MICRETTLTNMYIYIKKTFYFQMLLLNPLILCQNKGQKYIMCVKTS